MDETPTKPINAARVMLDVNNAFEVWDKAIDRRDGYSDDLRFRSHELIVEARNRAMQYLMLAQRWQQTLEAIVDFEPDPDNIEGPYVQIAAFAKEKARKALPPPPGPRAGGADAKED